MTIQPAIFETHEIRRIYDEETETWWFSVVDIVQVLTQQPDFQAARNYWKVLKNRLAKEGSESVTNCNRLKLRAVDGKKYLTDVATAETLLRLVQSVPSPKAEPIKLWLAKVGYERMQEMADPALSLDRARETWQKHGRSEKWIQQRMTGQETRNKLTDYWASHEIRKGEDFAILTNIIHQEWSDVSVKAHKTMKGLLDHNLRDHMSEAELIFTALAELSTRQIAQTDDATGMAENTAAATKGGAIAKQARQALEAKTGRAVVSADNFLLPGAVTRPRTIKKSIRLQPRPRVRAQTPTADVQIPRLSVHAFKLWNAIPTEAKKTILANVYCAHCRGGVSIVEVTGTVKGGDLILNGKCAVCGHDAARHVESLLS